MSANKERKRDRGENRNKARRRERGEGRNKKGNACRLTFRGVGMLWRESRLYVALVYVEYLLNACMPYWGIWFSARLLDEILTRRSPEILIRYTVLLIGGNLVLQSLQVFLRNASSQREFAFYQKERMIFARKIMGMDYALLEDEKVHVLYKRVMRESYNDGKNLQIIRIQLPYLLGDLAGMGLAVAMVWEFLVQMRGYGLWLILFVLVVAGGIWISGKSESIAQRFYIECSQEISENCLQRDGYLHYFEQYTKGKEIRIYQLGKLMIGRLLSTHYFNDRALDKRLRKSLPCFAFSGFTEQATVTLTYCITGFAALTGRITLGSMTQYISCIQSFIRYTQTAWSRLVILWANADYLERYFEFLDMPSQMQSGCIPVEKRVDGDYRIKFDHVSFRYPGSKVYALKDITMEFQVGEKMAVVGMNGSGKSTFIKLLCRLYDPTEGVISMNGIDIRKYDYQEYMSLFSVVFQDFKLFSFELGENVAVSEEYSTEAVRESLVKAGLGEFLETHENGIKMILYRDFDRDGVEVSGGEAQKIALARAVCKGAPFVLLDEPTAALDPLAEYEIYKRFNDLVADRTTVYISHRMSSCRFCDDIAVFHEGRLVQRGNHESLMEAAEGKYHELWTAQAQYYQVQG